MQNEVISVICRDDLSPQAKGGSRAAFLAQSIPTSSLTEGLADFANRIDSILDGVKLASKEFYLDEIEVKVDITASGKVWLIGTVEAGATGGISMKFKRRENA